MSNNSTWLTLGLAGLGAAAATASRGSANTLTPLEIDYSQTLITGELWTSDWMVEQTSSQWYDLGPEDEDDQGEPLLRQPWPDRDHPYHLLAYDVKGGRARKVASMERLTEHLERVYRDVLLPDLGLQDGRMWNRGFVRSHWKESPSGEVGMDVIIGLCNQIELIRIIQRLHELEEGVSDRIVLEMGAHNEVSFHDLTLYPQGVNRRSYPLVNVKIRRGLGGRAHILIEHD
jgi:hypothetical protein